MERLAKSSIETQSPEQLHKKLMNQPNLFTAMHESRTRDIKQDQYEFLRREITRWEEDELLEPGRGAEILSKYRVRPKQLMAFKILGLFGAGILGIGILLFIAANWGPEFNPHKSVIALGLMVLCYYAGSYLRKKPLYESIGEPCVLLANLVFGAIIMMACQHYHISANPPIELLVWGVSSAMIAWAFNSSACAVLSCLGLGIYSIASTEVTPFAIAAAILAICCAYITRSPYALGLVLLMAGMKLYMTLGYGWNSNAYDATAVTIYGAVCFLMHLFHFYSIRNRVMHVPYLLGACGGLCLGLLIQISNSSSYYAEKASGGYLWWASMCFVTLLMLSGYTLRKHRCFPRVIAGLMYIFSILPVLAVGTEFKLAALQAALAAVCLSLTIYVIAWLEQPIYCVVPLLTAVCYFTGYASTISSNALMYSIAFSIVGAHILFTVFLASLNWWRKTRLSPLFSSHASIPGQ